MFGFKKKQTAEINATMKKYVDEGVFTVYPNSYIYVERTLENGSIREGLVGMVDLDAYDYNPGATSAIRATERTVPERIPPRQRVRRDAPIELPHVLMLCDDHDKKLIEPICAKKEDGSTNLAPICFVSYLSFNPPMVGFATGKSFVIVP